MDIFCTPIYSQYEAVRFIVNTDNTVSLFQYHWFPFSCLLIRKHDTEPLSCQLPRRNTIELISVSILLFDPTGKDESNENIL